MIVEAVEIWGLHPRLWWVLPALLVVNAITITRTFFLVREEGLRLEGDA